MTTLTLRDHPFVRDLLKKTIGYRKHVAFFSVFSSPVRVNSYWDGGSRDEFVLVELATGKPAPFPPSHPYFDIERHGGANRENDLVVSDHVGNVSLKKLPPGWVLIKHGTFCGKPATAHVYANSGDLVPSLEHGATP